MKKTLVTFIITILILMAGITTVQGLSFGVKITPSSANVQKGDTVTLVLSVNNLDVGANGINTFLATLEYDQTVFNAVTADDVNALNRWDTPTYNPSNGKILTAKGSFVNSESDVIEVKLTAKTTAKTGSTTVTFKDIEASNSQNDIKVANTSYVLNIIEKTSGDHEEGGGTVTVEKPKVTVNYENMSNGIKVTLTSDRELSATAGWTLSADKKQLSKVYAENYNGTITVEDANGNKSDAITINVKLPENNNGNNSGTTTDKTKPTATVSYSKDATGKVTVTITASEEIQPLTGWTLSADKKKLTKVYTENYSGTITITDLAGNKSDAITIKVDKSQENGGANSGNNNNGNGGTADSELPKAGLEAYILPTILLITLAGTVAFIRYKSMEY